jgi:hypothetical protein
MKLFLDSVAIEMMIPAIFPKRRPSELWANGTSGLEGFFLQKVAK